MKNRKDFWRDLTPAVQYSIMKGRSESRQGKTSGHKEVMKTMKERFLK